MFIYRHCQFSHRVRELLEQDGGFEECAIACKKEIKHGILSTLTLNNSYVIAGDSRGTKAVRAACKEVGSVSDIIFEMRFNANVFSPGTA